MASSDRVGSIRSGSIVLGRSLIGCSFTSYPGGKQVSRAQHSTSDGNLLESATRNQ